MCFLGVTISYLLVQVEWRAGGLQTGHLVRFVDECVRYEKKVITEGSQMYSTYLWFETRGGKPLRYSLSTRSHSLLWTLPV